MIFEAKHRKAPLEGLVVADFSRVLAGPFATMMLADLGAEVIKVERAEGDDTRSWGPPFAATGESAYYLSVNRNKQSVIIDLRSTEGRKLALSLAVDADILVENFRPGVMKSKGLDYDSVSRLNPGIIYCSITGFPAGPLESLPGYDFLIQAMSGLMSITGEGDGQPMKTGVAIVDVLTGMYATVGILTALVERQRSGLGQRVCIDLMSSALSGLVNQASSFLNAGVNPARLGNDHPSIAPYGVFDTGTDPIVIAVGTDEQFKRLCVVIASPEAANDPSFQNNAARVENRPALREFLMHRLRARPAPEWLALLKAHDVPSGPINDIAGALQWAADHGLDCVITTEGSAGQEFYSMALPLRFSRSSAVYRRPPPSLGQDSADVTRRYLSYVPPASSA